MPNKTDDIYTPYAFETLAVSSAALPLSSTVYATGEAEPVMARITTATDAVKYRTDGGVPTSGAGHHLAINTNADIFGAAAIRALRVIRVTNDATLSVTYFRRED